MNDKEILVKLNNGEIKINELYKALIAYSLGFIDISIEDEMNLKNIIKYYYDTDSVTGFINETLIDKAEDIFGIGY